MKFGVNQLFHILNIQNDLLELFIDVLLILLIKKIKKYVINYVLKNNTSELQCLEKYHLLSAEQKHANKEIRLENFVNNQFKKIDYDECIKLLEKNQENFVFNDIK